MKDQLLELAAGALALLCAAWLPILALAILLQPWLR